MYYSATMQQVKGYPLYRMDEFGNFVSAWRGKKLNHTEHDGYKTVTLKKDKESKSKCLYVHRLLAFQFIPIPDRLKNCKEIWVNHKNGIKSDNNLDNLEWSSISENIQHSYDTLLRIRITGSKHWNYGKHPSEPTRKLMSDSKLGVNHPKFSGYYIAPDGSKYATSHEIAKAMNINYKTAFRWCKQGKNGYSFQ